MSPPAYKLRACRPEDRDFLWALKQATMRAYVEQTWGRWDETEQADFFLRSFLPARLRIIVVGNSDAGSLYVTRPPGEIFLAAIEILPEFQARGIGSAVIRELQAGSRAEKVPLRLQVLKVNLAGRRLYQRLGFESAGETDTHHLMIFRP